MSINFYTRKIYQNPTLGYWSFWSQGIIKWEIYVWGCLVVQSLAKTSWYYNLLFASISLSWVSHAIFYFVHKFKTMAGIPENISENWIFMIYCNNELYFCWANQSSKEKEHVTMVCVHKQKQKWNKIKKCTLKTWKRKKIYENISRV